MVDQRRTPRTRMIKSAQIAFGDVCFECVALDLSVTGALVYLPVLADVPEVVTLRLPDGTTRPARRCWGF